MINGAHIIIYSSDAEADRRFFREVLEFPHVDVGHGWLIFALPPSEVAVHPADPGEKHELYLMCEDVELVAKNLSGKGIECSEVSDQGWGRIISVKLPGGSDLGIYQPKHERPPAG